jgi:2-keto-4-pentenoate hydratase/2-oxohepta-3-ene-1,7-dioic acid hydratase in catechol pathway
MKLCRFNDDRLGVVDDNAVLDVTPVLEGLPPERWPLQFGDSLIRNLPAVRKAVEKALSKAPRHLLSQVALKAPVANPSKIVAAPANYVEHVKEGQRDPGIHHGVHDLITTGYDTPSDKYGLFLKANSSLIGPSEPVQLHFEGRRNDHEVEVVAVIGKQCKNVAKRDAWGVIAGYTLGLDLSVRGGEDRSFRKSADTYAVLGPWLTTADEVPEPENVDFSLSVNGVLRQSSNTRLLTASIPRIIEIATSCYTLYPGDLIYTGTPEGVGPLQAGDVMEVQSPVLGRMTVRVAKRGA